ncbi:hypothetical protein Bbelb_216530 [Branchiostoma belcheri]|nr:hypothetical protein Bbelb_216530 [Branchiostoma belcheri]
MTNDTITGGSTFQPLALFNKEPPYSTQALSWKARVCEGSTMKISCDPGQRIDVVSALYGRMLHTVCPGGNVRTLYCQNPASLGRVRSLCQGKSVCSVLASSSVFGDPCKETFKYLEVSYICTGLKCEEPE